MTDGEVGQDINRAISLNNGVYQQLQGIGSGQRELPASAREVHYRLERANPHTEALPYIEGEFEELSAALQRALPPPLTEREKRLARYKRRPNRN